MIKFFLLISFSTCFTLNAQNANFSLIGKTSNIEDGTYLFLRDLVNRVNIDSVLVQNNSFKISTELDGPAFTMLFTKDRKNFKELWLENNNMTFDASNVPFNEAVVTGSINQNLIKKVNSEVHLNIVETSPDTVKKREKEFIIEHPGSLVSAYLLYDNRRMTRNEVRELFLSLSDEVQNSSLGQNVAKILAKDLFELGDKYADFTVPNAENEPKQISELTGKLTLLQFWSSTCSGSRAMNSTLNDVYKKYHSKEFNIVSISKDTTKENWIKAINEDNLSWPQLSSLDGWQGEVFSAYGIASTPSNILIDSTGIIVGKNIMSSSLENEIIEHLK